MRVLARMICSLHYLHGLHSRQQIGRKCALREIRQWGTTERAALGWFPKGRLVGDQALNGHIRCPFRAVLTATRDVLRVEQVFCLGSDQETEMDFQGGGFDHSV